MKFKVKTYDPEHVSFGIYYWIGGIPDPAFSVPRLALIGW